MKTKVLVTLALIVTYLLMAIFHIDQQVMAPVMCAAIAAVLFWPARRKK